MPIYEYQCKACGHQFDIIQDFNEDPLSDCPVCHKVSLNKLISAPSFQLKGTGWYVTDFKDSGKKPAAKASAKTDSVTENKTDTQSETSSKAKKQKSDSSKGDVKS